LIEQRITNKTKGKDQNISFKDNSRNSHQITKAENPLSTHFTFSIRPRPFFNDQHYRVLQGKLLQRTQAEILNL